MAAAVATVFHEAVETVAVAAEPEGAVARQAEGGDLVDDARLVLVELMRDGVVAEGAVAVAPRTEVDPDDALHAAHPEESLAVDDGADAARDAATALEGFLEALALVVVEVESGIAADPEAVVDGVVGEGAHEARAPVELTREFEVGDTMGSAPVGDADTSAPGAYPKAPVVVGGERRHAVVRQAGVGGSVVDEVAGACLAQVQPALDGAHPEAAAGLDIHRVDGVRGERAWVGAVNGIAEQQPLGDEADDAARLGADPDIALVDADAVDEVALQRHTALGGPGSEGVALVVVDVHAA